MLDRNVFRPENGPPLKIAFKAVEDGRVTAKVFNLAGELVEPVFDADVFAGVWFQATWDGRNRDNETVASGVYFVSIKGGGLKSMRKVVVLK